MVIHISNHHGIDLDGFKTQALGQLDRLKDFLQAVAACHLVKIDGVQGIQAEGHAIQPGLLEGVCMTRKRKTIAGQCQVLNAINLGKPLNETGQLVSQ